MTVPQYGIWTNIFDYTGYFILFSGLLPFWATRFVARGKEGTVKTSCSAQLIISIVSMAIYFPVMFFVYTLAIAPKIHTEIYLPFFLIAGLYILTFHMISCFEANLQSIKPQALGYGFLIEEVVKVGIGLLLILVFKQLFLGAMLALVLSCFVQIGYYISLLSDELRQKPNWSYLKEWLKGSTAIAYNAVGGQLVAFVLIMLFFYGGPATRAYYQAAASFAGVIIYAGSVSSALYPKLLSKNCTTEQVGTSFRTQLMLAIPLTVLAMVMSVSFLTILNVAYAVAWPVLVALSINNLIVLITQFYTICLMGVESFDEAGKISIRQLVRSKIFKVFSLNYIQAAIALPIAYVVLTRLPVGGSPMAAVYVIIILIGVQLSTFVGLYHFMRRAICIPVAWVSIAKYVLASSAMAAFLFLLPATTTLLSTIAKAIGGFGIYVVLLLAIDKQARQLIRMIWEEIKVTVRQLTSKGNGEVFSGENGAKTTEN
jgi:hypothetical protein